MALLLEEKDDECYRITIGGYTLYIKTVPTIRGKRTLFDGDRAIGIKRVKLIDVGSEWSEECIESLANKKQDESLNIT